PGTDVTSLQRALGPFARLRTELSAQKPRRFYDGENGTAYWRLARGFLLDLDVKVANELLRFTWDGSCSTGTDRAENEQMTLVLLGLLRERRIGEALGASFFVRSTPTWLPEPGRLLDQWQIDLLQFCGFDWEDVLLAANRLDLLAAAGSEKAVRQLLAR